MGSAVLDTPTETQKADDLHLGRCWDHVQREVEHAMNQLRRRRELDEVKVPFSGAFNESHLMDPAVAYVTQEGFVCDRRTEPATSWRKGPGGTTLGHLDRTVLIISRI